MDFKNLNREFFQHETTIVARELLGKLFVRKIEQNLLSAEIVETEAYLPKDDPACHASKRKTLRNAPMFECGGILYVYFIYGNHFCANIVTETNGVGSAVLIRAAKPIEGTEFMEKYRRKTNIKDLCSGPGKFAQAFDLNREHNYHPLDSEDIYITDYKKYDENEIVRTTRIGIKEGVELPLRFYLKNSPFISRK